MRVMRARGALPLVGCVACSVASPTNLWRSNLHDMRARD
jgi:hypothetical protein